MTVIWAGTRYYQPSRENIDVRKLHMYSCITTTSGYASAHVVQLI